MSERLNRVAEAIKQEVARILQRELKDPRIGFVTVTRVAVTADLQRATVYFSLFSPQNLANPPVFVAGPPQNLADSPSAEEERSALAGTEAGLKSAAGYIRRLIGERLKLRFTPEIQFRSDPSVAESIRMSKLLGDLKKESEGA